MNFEFLRQTRRNHLSVIELLNNEQLNTIPAGFNNNLIWNLGHVLVTQQLLCYKLSGNRLRIDTNLVDKYRKGSQPEGPVSDAEIEQLKEYMLQTVDQMESDYQAGWFQEYQDYSTSYGVKLRSITDAMTFNLAHEAMHLGTMMALRRLL